MDSRKILIERRVKSDIDRGVGGYLSLKRVQYSEWMNDQALFLKSTLISTPLGTTMEVTSLSWDEVHSRSIYLLKTVISQLSQVLEPSPQGVLLQQILRCLLGILTGPLSLI